MDMLPYSLSLPPTAWVSGTESSSQSKPRKTRSKRAGTFTSCAAGSGEKIIKEEAKNVCERPHSGIRLSVINEVDNNSMKGEYDNKRNKTNNATANGNTEMSIGSSGFSLHSPGYICKGGFVLNTHNNNICKGVDESTGEGGMFGSRPVYPISVNHACILTKIVVCPVSFVHNWEGEAQLILKIFVKAKGADLRRFDKYKKRAT
jgi:hypothetical protein